MKDEAAHLLKDPAKLTPYEEKLLLLRNKGMTYVEMSKVLDGAANPKTIAARFMIIREKIKLKEAENEQ
jgi:DNA-binding CsgD family transcriptional regulator